MTKLSIIVPIHGVEQYLRKCVDSLLAQDLASSEYEIILVDDESPDACPQICDEYARKSQESRAESQEPRAESQELPCIRVVHRKNGGLSAARNSGIEIAKGDYLMFVDSDDYIEPNVLGVLVRTMEEKQLDVLRFNYQNVRIVESQDLRVKIKYEVFEPHKNPKPYFDYSSEVVDGETFLNDRLGFACYACQFLIRRELLDGCTFTPGIYFEDTDWTPRMLLTAKRVASTELVVYHYLWREGSITLPTSPEKKQKILDDRMKLLHGFQEQRKLVTDDRWFKWHTASLVITILSTIASYSRAKRDTYIREIQSLNVFPLATYRAVGNNKYKIRLANISPSLYCILIRIIRK